jgi:hypothetical protein
MTRDHLGSAVVWSAPLVALVVGAQLAVLACVGVFASTPPAVTLEVPYPGPANNESVIVTFAPTAVWGDRALDLGFPLPPASYSLPPHCYPGSLIPGCSLVISIAGCSDSNCEKLGTFRATTVESWTDPYPQVQVPPQVTTFLVTVWNVPGAMFVLPVEMVWLDGPGFPMAVTSSGAVFTGALPAGLVVVVVAWAIGHRSGQRWVREYIFFNPAQEAAPAPRHGP